MKKVRRLKCFLLSIDKKFVSLWLVLSKTIFQIMRVEKYTHTYKPKQKALMKKSIHFTKNKIDTKRVFEIQEEPPEVEYLIADTVNINLDEL